jgi:hypothetical protein
VEQTIVAIIGAGISLKKLEAVKAYPDYVENQRNLKAATGHMR